MYYHFCNTGVTLNEDLQVTSRRDLRICNGQIRELVIGRLNQEIAGKLVESINVLRESYIGNSSVMLSPPGVKLECIIYQNFVEAR